MPAQPVVITAHPYPDDYTICGFHAHTQWPCAWVSCPDAGAPPFVTAYRRAFSLDAAVTFRAHVSADQRYELFLDGARIGRGSERGDRANWFYESYDFELDAGAHVLVARTWSLDHAPWAQISVYPGFIFAPEGDAFIRLLGTGVAPWEAKRLDGYRFVSTAGSGTGAKVDIDGARFPWGFETGGGSGWRNAVTRQKGTNGFNLYASSPIHLMQPATLPPQVSTPHEGCVVRHVAQPAAFDAGAGPLDPRADLAGEHAAWTALLRGTALTVPARTARRVIIDCGDYVCAYPALIVTGGAGSVIRVRWAESLFAAPTTDGWKKDNRDDVDGKCFIGIGDTFRPDGGAHRAFDTLWWHAGRYIELTAQTAATPLVIEEFRVTETGYPYETESAFACDDKRFDRLLPLCVRTARMCAHETYMDCPYYEQLMYIGDTRIQALITHAVTRDARLPRKALRMFDSSRANPTRITTSNHPANSGQIIPTFSLLWLAMIHDYALWRGDEAFVRTLMPGARAVLDIFLDQRNEDGLLVSPHGWNYVDVAEGWRDGIPPGGTRGGISGVINWHLALALSCMSDLEAFTGGPELAARALRLRNELVSVMRAVFWDEGRGLFADDPARRAFSEHSQCLALLGGALDEETRGRVARGLASAPGLTRANIYFTHYLFEALHQAGGECEGVLFDRLARWFDLPGQGFRTTPESWGATRSDCHAWSAAPLYHCFATILGIRPASFGFATVSVRPALGPLNTATGTLVHPRGSISVSLAREGGGLQGRITLPAGVTGTLEANGARTPLAEGLNEVLS
ncbi:alpha-L-rhamnosidase [bacterium]|nr:alpha-L-rhamnosidase [bacterium]